MAPTGRARLRAAGFLFAALLLGSAGPDPARGGEGDESFAPDVTVAGFADVLCTLTDAEGAPFSLGQVEVDVETSVHPYVDLGIAVAYDPDGETFGLGAMTADFRLFGDPETHFRESSIEHAGVIVGQFDVPFGLDWLVYPSFDRQLITAPLVVGGTHDGWNDLGAQAYLEHGSVNSVVYLCNGFDTDAAVSERAAGGRFGFLPAPWIEVGASGALVDDERGNRFQSLLGADLQVATGPWSAKGEFVSHRTGEQTDDPLKHEGFYLQLRRETGFGFLVARHGVFRPGATDEPDLERTSLGCGWVLGDGCEMRCEYGIGGEALDDLAQLQWVVAY